MIKDILLYDDEDDDLGDFFRLCSYKYMKVAKQCVAFKHDSKSCKDAIERSMSKCNNSKFLLVSFLHGSDDALYLSKKEVISPHNAYFLSNAFCYTFSCHCGKNLAQILLDNGACTFWGYIDNVSVIVDNEDDFADLAVSGLRHFYCNKTVGEAYDAVKKEYTSKIDALYKTDYFCAATLMYNRDSMILLGDKNLAINDFT